MVLKSLVNAKHKFVILGKHLWFGSKGEPYTIGEHTLRYIPGTRPVKLHYIKSESRNVRYDAMQVKIFSENLQEGDCAIDIGGHAGQYALIMAAMCGYTGHVVTFEPDPYAREKLLKNISLNPQIKPPVVEALAVSDSNGKSVLYSRGGNAQSSLARSGVEFVESHKSTGISVPLVSLDSYLETNHLPSPKWLKIDAEGAEVHILRGAEKVLKGNTNIICEIHPYTWPEFGVTLDDLKHLVKKSGRMMRYLDRDDELGDEAEYGTVILERHN